MLPSVEREPRLIGVLDSSRMQLVGDDDLGLRADELSALCSVDWSPSLEEAFLLPYGDLPRAASRNRFVMRPAISDLASWPYWRSSRNGPW